MKTETALKAEECALRIQEGMDSRFAFGQERFTGWVAGPLFSLSYASGRELGRRFYPIFNKTIGWISRRGSGASIRTVHFSGLTDPVSVLLLTMLTAALLILMESGLPFGVCLLLGLCLAASFALPTFLCTMFSEAGREGRQRLEERLIELLRE